MLSNQKLLLGYVGFILLLIYTKPVVATDDLPPPFTAYYRLYFEGIPAGEATRTLTYLDTDRFKFSSVARTTGLAKLFQGNVEEYTLFERVNGQIRPLEYVYQQTGRKPRNRRISFDWINYKATGIDEDKSYQLPLKTGMSDRLLYQLVLMRDLKQGKKEPRYQVIKQGQIKTYAPKFLGKASVETKIGYIDTVKYEKVTHSKRRTTFWCAPTLYYLPVQAEHLEKGNILRMVLKSVQGLDK